MSKTEKMKGVIVPMISPFTTDGAIDTSASRQIVSYLAKGGASAFIQGTTGEGLSISNRDRIRFAEAAVAAERGDQLLYAGISHHSFADSVELANRFFDLGVDVAVAHLPTFYPLNDAQISSYFERPEDAIHGPLLIYNIPKTVHMSISVNVVEELSRHPNIYGIKDSEADAPRLEALVNFCNEQDDFCHLLGWAAQSGYAISIGSNGIVPSTGNLVPGLYRQLYEAARRGDIEKAQKFQVDTNAISRIYQRGKSLPQSLAALKVMMQHFGLCESHMLPPIKACSQEEWEEILKKVASCDQLNHLSPAGAV